MALPILRIFCLSADPVLSTLVGLSSVTPGASLHLVHRPIVGAQIPAEWMDPDTLLTAGGGLGWGPRSLQEREAAEQIRVSPALVAFFFSLLQFQENVSGKEAQRLVWLGRGKKGEGSGSGGRQAWGGSLQPQAAEGVASVFAPLECS